MPQAYDLRATQQEAVNALPVLPVHAPQKKQKKKNADEAKTGDSLSWFCKWCPSITMNDDRFLFSSGTSDSGNCRRVRISLV